MLIARVRVFGVHRVYRVYRLQRCIGCIGFRAWDLRLKVQVLRLRLEGLGFKKLRLIFGFLRFALEGNPVLYCFVLCNPINSYKW